MDDSRCTSAPPARGPCDRDGTRCMSRDCCVACLRVPSDMTCTARAAQPRAALAAGRPHGSSHTEAAWVRGSDRARDGSSCSRRRVGRARSSACRHGRSRSSPAWTSDRASRGRPRIARARPAPTLPRAGGSSRRTRRSLPASARARGDSPCNRRGRRRPCPAPVRVAARAGRRGELRLAGVRRVTVEARRGRVVSAA